MSSTDSVLGIRYPWIPNFFIRSTSQGNFLLNYICYAINFGNQTTDGKDCHGLGR